MAVTEFAPTKIILPWLGRTVPNITYARSSFGEYSFFTGPGSSTIRTKDGIHLDWITGTRGHNRRIQRVAMVGTIHAHEFGWTSINHRTIHISNAPDREVYDEPIHGLIYSGKTGHWGPARSWNPGPQNHSWNHAFENLDLGDNYGFHYWDNPDDVPEPLWAVEYLNIPWGPQPKTYDLLNIPWEHTRLLTRRLLNIPWQAPDDTLRANNLLHIEWGEPAIPVVRELLEIPWVLEPKELRVRHLLNIPWTTGELEQDVRPRVYCFGEQRGYPKVLRDQDKVKAGTPEAYHTLGIKWFNPLPQRGQLLKIELFNPSTLEKIERGYYDD